MTSISEYPMGIVLMYASERSSHCQNRGDLSIRRGGREKKSCGVRKSDGNRKVGEGGRESWPFEFSPTVMFGTNHMLYLPIFFAIFRGPTKVWTFKITPMFCQKKYIWQQKSKYFGPDLISLPLPICQHWFSSCNLLCAYYFGLNPSRQVRCLIWLVPLMVWTTSNWTDHCTLRRGSLLF